MIQFLVSPTANKESANKPSVPPISLIHDAGIMESIV